MYFSHNSNFQNPRSKNPEYPEYMCAIRMRKCQTLKNPEYPNNLCVLFTQIQFTQIRDPKNPEYPEYLCVIWMQKCQTLKNPEYPNNLCVLFTQVQFSKSEIQTRPSSGLGSCDKNDPTDHFLSKLTTLLKNCKIAPSCDSYFTVDSTNNIHNAYCIM